MFFYFILFVFYYRLYELVAVHMSQTLQTIAITLVNTNIHHRQPSFTHPQQSQPLNMPGTQSQASTTCSGHKHGGSPPASLTQKHALTNEAGTTWAKKTKVDNDPEDEQGKVKKGKGRGKVKKG